MNSLLNSINEISNAHVLLELKKQIDKQIEKNYNLKENFMYHSKVDDYIYQVDYIDGSYRKYCKGAEAYEHYINESNATSIQRCTKDLFPKYEMLMNKNQIIMNDIDINMVISKVITNYHTNIDIS